MKCHLCDRNGPAKAGGEKGIRTLGTVSRTHAFQACSFNHSDISPSLESTVYARSETVYRKSLFQNVAVRYVIWNRDFTAAPTAVIVEIVPARTPSDTCGDLCSGSRRFNLPGAEHARVVERSAHVNRARHWPGGRHRLARTQVRFPRVKTPRTETLAGCPDTPARPFPNDCPKRSRDVARSARLGSAARAGSARRSRSYRPCGA